MARRQGPPVMVSAVIGRQRSGTHETMICKLAGPPYAGKWMFPAGPAEEGESPEAAMRRVLREKLGAQVEIVYGQPPFDQDWEGTLHRWRVFFCEADEQSLNNKFYQEIRWVSRAHLQEYEFEPVSQQVVNWILDDTSR